MFRQYGRRSVEALLLVVVIGVLPAAAGPAGRGARVVAEEQVGPHLVDLTIESPALGRTAKVRLLTPDGWDQRPPSADWPVFYLLHGCCDTYDSWRRETDVEELAQLRDVLVVMPEGGPVGWYSDWWNHGEDGPPAWETFHLGELRRLLERGYGAGDSRVIAGLSVGGFGALSYAARNPGMFQAAASYSGVVHPLYASWPEEQMSLLEEFGEDPLALWGDPIAQRSIWEAHDPYYLADRFGSTHVFLSSGDGSKGPFDKRSKPDFLASLEVSLNEMNHVLALRLTEAGVQLTTDFYGPGTHIWPYWERELHRSLPLLLCALGSDQECQGAAA